MPSRKKQGEERSICGVTFKIPIDIPLSISMTPSVSKAFIMYNNNRNQKHSDVLRNILFEELKIPNTEKGVADFFEKTIKYCRENDIYPKLNVSKHNSFSKIIVDKINKKMQEE